MSNRRCACCSRFSVTAEREDCTVGELAAPGRAPVFASEYAPRLRATAVRDERLTRLIAGERWDVVVLQEQSAIPSLGGYREAHMFPAAEKLATMARERGARTVLFMTWGYKAGDQHDFPGNDSYPEMQERVAEGYTDLSLRLRAPVASVGLAWNGHSTSGRGHRCGRRTANTRAKPAPTSRRAVGREPQRRDPPKPITCRWERRGWRRADGRRASAPSWIRTSGLLLRRESLYPAELSGPAGQG